MHDTQLNRRVFAGLLCSLPAVSLLPRLGIADDSVPAAVVYRTPTCGCCGKWVDHLRASGFEVEVREVSSTTGIRTELGVPPQLTSCHTAVVGDYWVEGHVPADLVLRLLSEQPDDIAGIAVPGMPAGSPGMEAPRPVEYDIIAYGRDGKYYRYASRMGQSSAEAQLRPQA